MNLPAAPTPATVVNPQKHQLMLRRRARSLNLDKLSDSDAVDAFVGVVNSLMFAGSHDPNHGKVQIRWCSPDNKEAKSDPKHNVVQLPWPGPVVEPEKYLALRGYALQEFGRMKLTHPELVARVKKNGGEDAAQIAQILEHRRVDLNLEESYGDTYTDAKSQIRQDCEPTPEQQLEFDSADAPTKLVNDFTILAHDLGYKLSSDRAVVDRLKKWMKLADQQGTNAGKANGAWGYNVDDLKRMLNSYGVNAGHQQNASGQLTANLTQAFLTTFKDIFDQRPKKDPKDQQPDPNGQGDGDGQGDGGGGAGPSMGQQMQQGLASGADKGQFHQTVGDPTPEQEAVAGREGHGTGASSQAGPRTVPKDAVDLVDILRRRGARVAAQLRRSLAAKSRFGDETDMDDGDLDPDKLAEIARGKWDAPFMRPGRIIHDRDTAVHICLDGSGSMAGAPESHELLQNAQRRNMDPLEQLCAQMSPEAASAFRELAAALPPMAYTAERLVDILLASKIWVSGACLAIHDALRSSRIAHEVSVFDGPYIVLKNWKQRSFPPNVMNQFKLGGYCGGGTPAGTSWKNSLGSLIKRRETRRILIVMSDGEIPSDEAKIGTAVIATARQIGIECYGLGIRSDGVKKVFPRGDKSVATVGYSDDLNRKMQDLVHGILTKAEQRG